MCPAVPPPARTTDKWDKRDSVFMEAYLRFRAGLLGAGVLVAGFRLAGVPGESVVTADLGAADLGAAAAAGTVPLTALAVLLAVLPAFFLTVFLTVFLDAFPAAFLAAPRSAFRFRRDAASPAGPNLNNRLGWIPGAI